MDVFADRINKFLVLLGGVGVVETEVGLAVIFLSDAEVEANGLGVADMQVAVGFGRKTGMHTSAVLAVGDVAFDNLFDKVEGRLFSFFLGDILFFHSVSMLTCKDTNKPRVEPNLFGLFLGIDKGQARLDGVETEEQGQAILLGFTEAKYLQQSEAKLKIRKFLIQTFPR